MIFKAGDATEFNNPNICIEKKQPEPGVLAGTPINVKICTELQGDHRASSVKSDPGYKYSSHRSALLRPQNVKYLA